MKQHLPLARVFFLVLVSCPLLAYHHLPSRVTVLTVQFFFCFFLHHKLFLFLYIVSWTYVHLTVVQMYACCILPFVAMEYLFNCRTLHVVFNITFNITFNIKQIFNIIIIINIKWIVNVYSSLVADALVVNPHRICNLVSLSINLS